jgi:hypothetical protein
MFFSLREFDVSGMLVDPAAAMLAISAVLYFIVLWGINHLIDLNRFVWRRPVIDLAIFVILYSLAILTLKPI